MAGMVCGCPVENAAVLSNLAVTKFGAAYILPP